MTTELEAWLQDVPAPALKAFAEDMPGVREAKKPVVIAYVLNTCEARERAMESMRVAQRVAWLQDRRDRLQRAVTRLEERLTEVRLSGERARLGGKIEGVKLALSYLEEDVRAHR